MLYGGIPAGLITNMLADISPGGGTTWIMDEDNRIISHNNNFFYNQVISFEKLSESAKVLEGEESGIFETVNQKGDKATVFHSMIPYTDNWRLCTVIDSRRILAHTRSIMKTIIIFWFILIFASVYLSMKLSQHIVVPLEKLTRSMKDFEKGSLSPIEIDKMDDDFYYLSQTYNSMTRKISQLFEEILVEQKKARESELRALQSQINPHFLYNTLDTMKWMAMDYGADDIQEMLGSLSSFFRLSLSDGKEIIPLYQEIEHAGHYLKVQQIRYSDIMDYDIHIEDQVRDIPCMKLIIQPLVENAIYHGIKPKGAPGTISIDTSRREEMVVITVADTGVGMSREKLEEIRRNMESVVPNEHYGIFNIAERLRIYYDGKASITIDSGRGEGTKVSISFPASGGRE
jgi:two-component system sensor histidine kinase YesM